MFNVTMYSFTKKENSTARPSGSGTTYNCILRRGSSAINPTIELNVGAAGNPTGNNYAYIPAFNRFYFIEDWQFEDGIWTAAMRCDVLATYKIEIGAQSLYILRASAAYDGRIVDTMYPVKTGCTFSTQTATNPWTLTSGNFVVGVANANPTIGSLCYYVLSAAQMANLCNLLLGPDSDSIWQDLGFNTDDASLELQKSIVDPIQFIKSAVYIPTAIDTSEMTLRVISLNSLLIKESGSIKPPVASAFGSGQTKTTISRSFTIPKHPQAEARGVYMNASPNSVYTLTFPPFGVIELDSTVLSNATTLQCTIEIDHPTGLGILTVMCNNIVMNRLEAQVGVPVQVSQITHDYVGGISSILSAMGSAVPLAAGLAVGGMGGAAAAGLATGGAAGIASNLGNAVKSLAPRTQSVGSGGSYSQLTFTPRLDAQFFEAVADDNAHNGRPYCQMATPSSLGGYLLVQDGDVPIDGTSEESARVRAYLEGGFYYE